MKYFKSFIPDPAAPRSNDATVQAEADDIDISVHCDVYIFEFLVKYMNDPETPPPLENNTVVSILISSEFLQMEELVSACLAYVAKNLEDILCLPVDLACISDSLCAKLAKLCPAESLVGLTEKKGKLLPRLYKKRLEIDFRERPSRDVGANLTSNSSCLICCRHCYQLFPESEVTLNGGYVKCQRSNPSAVEIGFHGEVNGPECEPVEHWSLTAFVASLRKQRLEWAEIYWMLWSAAHMLRLEDGALVPADSEWK